MGKVIVGLTMSLDGFIAGPDDGPDQPLGEGGGRHFFWMNAGPESNRVNEHMAPPDASRPVVDAWQAECGAVVSGRRTFDIAGGWKNGHPIDVPIFVVTHEPPTHGEWSRRITFVPYLLGGGVRLFDNPGPDPIELEQTSVIESTGVTHLRYRVLNT